MDLIPAVGIPVERIGDIYPDKNESSDDGLNFLTPNDTSDSTGCIG